MNKRKQVFHFVIFLSLFFVSCSHAQIIAGVGVDKYLLGAEEGKIFQEIGSREKLAKKGLFFTFEKNHVTTILIISSKYLDEEGLRVGDSINKIKNITNVSSNAKVQLEKGAETIPTEDNIIIFPGIRYIVNDEVITAILVVKE